jgi:uncharacterized protein
MRKRLLKLTATLHGVGALLVGLFFSWDSSALVVAIVVGVALLWVANTCIRDLMFDKPYSRARIWGLHIPFFVHWCALVFVLVAALPTVVLWGVAAFAGASVSLKQLIPLLYPVGLVVSAYGILIRARWVRLRRVEIRVDGLPAAFDNTRIIHLSDLHMGAHTPRERIAGWVKRVNALRPDLVVMTGDFVTNGTAFHTAVTEILGELRAPLGVFATMGNHDYFGDGRGLIEGFAREGVRLLQNEGVLLARDTAQVYLAGVDDTWTRRADLGAALNGRPASMCTLLLAHDPNLFESAQEAGVALTLSGHTHSGQIAVPFLAARYSLSNLAHRYHGGLYWAKAAGKRCALFVSAGLGTTGLPIRIGAAPELVELVLKR